MSEIKKYAVIVAGGKGVRMASAIPKQFLPLGGVPLICRTIQAFCNAMSDIQIVLVVPPDQQHSMSTIIKSYLSTQKIVTVTGGDTRFHSVQNGLKAVQNNGVVFVHDGVRPLVSASLINRCYEQAVLKGSAIPCVPVTDSIRRVRDDDESEPVSRDRLRVIQTPQTFRTALILPAFQQDYNPLFTDEATVVEAYGQKVFMIDGEYSNLKITTPDDITIAESLLKATN